MDRDNTILQTVITSIIEVKVKPVCLVEGTSAHAAVYQWQRRRSDRLKVRQSAHINPQRSTDLKKCFYIQGDLTIFIFT